MNKIYDQLRKIGRRAAPYVLAGALTAGAGSCGKPIKIDGNTYYLSSNNKETCIRDNHPSYVGTVTLVDENNDGKVDYKKNDIVGARFVDYWTEEPTLEDKILFEKVLGGK